MSLVEVKTLSILIFIVSLLAEHCNFDRLRLEHEGKSICQASRSDVDTWIALAADLNTITKVVLSD